MLRQPRSVIGAAEEHHGSRMRERMRSAEHGIAYVLRMRQGAMRR
jgi:hypothetical protein